MPHRATNLLLLAIQPFVFAQSPDATVDKPRHQRVDEARLREAYADAQKACSELLGVELTELPTLKITDAEEVARAIADENLPSIRLREPDEEKARAQADLVGTQQAATTMAKYAWSTRSFLVVSTTWERTGRVLRRPQLTSDHTLRAVMVHELCHAIDDRDFDFAELLLRAKSNAAITACNAVFEGHAQVRTRRICAAKGWLDGFDAFAGAVGALPAFLPGGEANAQLLRAQAALLESAYHDGERFVAAVLAARPDTGRRDVFLNPPQDMETILEPGWYLDPKTRPALLYDLEPALDAFVASFDAKIWTAQRNNLTGKQIGTGMAMLPAEEVETIVRSLRAARLVQCAPTADPSAKVAILIAMEFDSEAAARRWIAASAKISAIKDDTMDKGVIRIVGSKTTPLDREGLHGFLQEKQMKNGTFAFDLATIDAMRGVIVLETVYSGDPPASEAHIEFVDRLLGKVARRK